MATGPAGVVVYDENVSLRTVEGVSRAVTGQQVLGSIVGFGLVYTLLGVVWLWVLTHKIKEGPDIPGPGPRGDRDDLKGFFDAAAERPDYSGSLADGGPKRPVVPPRTAGGGGPVTGLLAAVDPAAGPFAEDPATRDVLVTVWFLLLGVLLSEYAILDGFDLGVGILHPFVPKDETERRLAINAIGPLWDGNEVWLVTFGGAMLAMFPYAYAAVFSGFYTAFMLLLITLIFRAASIELRGKMRTPAGKRAWDWAFFAGSVGATFLFGVAAGNAVWGLPLDDRGTVTAGVVDQLHPYALLTGATAVAVFAMHGAIYLHLKTEGPLHDRLRGVMWPAFGVFLTLFLLQTMWTLAEVPRATANFRTSKWLWVVPVLNVLAVANIPRALYLGRPAAAFASSCFNIFGYVFLLMAALWPNVVAATDPANSLSVADAASSNKTLAIGLVVVAVGMPFVVTYTAVISWTFRGKVRLEPHSY